MDMAAQSQVMVVFPLAEEGHVLIVYPRLLKFWRLLLHVFAHVSAGIC